MPRGRGKSYKGRSRHFTSEDELARQAKEVKNWRKRAEEDDDDDDDNEKKPDLDEGEEGSEEDEEGKPAAMNSVIDIENPNRLAQKAHKVDALDVEAKPELTRREREAIEKEQARLRYQKLQAEGKTDEARADLARLAIIRKQREESAKKKEEEKQAKEREKVAVAEASRAAQEGRLTAGSQKAARKKRK